MATTKQSPKDKATAVKNTGNMAPSTKGAGAPVKKNANTPPATLASMKKGGMMKKGC